jgi:Sulfotransferase domain
MALRVVGAGLGRTGTHSLKLALEQLLDGPCYHMMETFGRPDDIPVWHAAVNGADTDWTTFLAEYVATVDWPAAAFWRELSDTFPDAVVLLSSRSSADAWYRSASDTIFQISQRELPPGEVDIFGSQMAMAKDMFTNTFTPHWDDPAEAKRAYEQHNADVRAAVDPARLIDWRPGDGWEPICAALSVPVPDEPFPHINTTADFRAMTGLDAPPT